MLQNARGFWRRLPRSEMRSMINRSASVKIRSSRSTSRGVGDRGWDWAVAGQRHLLLSPHLVFPDFPLGLAD